MWLALPSVCLSSSEGGKHTRTHLDTKQGESDKSQISLIEKCQVHSSREEGEEGLRSQEL